MSDDQVEKMSDTFNALIEAVEQDNADMRDCGSSQCDEDSLKIRRILSVLNKAIFCDLVIFREKVIFAGDVIMDPLTVRKMKAHKAKIDYLIAKKADIKKLTVKKSIETADLDVTGNIYMSNSTSASVGNIYKNDVPFIHNFGVNNTFVGDDAGNFTMTGGGNSGFGVGVLENNTTGGNNTALGDRALFNNTAVAITWH